MKKHPFKGLAGIIHRRIVKKKHPSRLKDALGVEILHRVLGIGELLIAFLVLIAVVENSPFV